MPLLPAQEDPMDAPVATFQRSAESQEGNTPGWLDVARVAGQQSFGDLYNKVKTDSFIMAGGDDPNYNPIEHLPAGGPTQHTSYADYPDFLDARNSAQMEQIRRKVDADAQGQETLARAGGAKAFAANMAIGSTDPLNLAMMALVPEVAPTRLGNALRLALTNAATTAGEAALQNSGEDFLTRGTALNVAGSAVLGGILGAAIRPRIPTPAFNAVSDAVHSVLHEGRDASSVLGEMRPSIASKGTLEPTITEFPQTSARPGEPTLEEDHPTVPIVNPGEGSTAGAMAVEHPLTGEDMNIALGARLFSRTVGKIYPDMRILNSESTAAKKTLLELADIKPMLEMDYQGRARPDNVENQLYRYDAMHLEGIARRKGFYAQYLNRMKEEGSQAMSFREFEEAMSHAANEGDRSPIPEVQAATADARQ